jgi:hypothetical protein
MNPLLIHYTLRRPVAEPHSPNRKSSSVFPDEGADSDGGADDGLSSTVRCGGGDAAYSRRRRSGNICSSTTHYDASSEVTLFSRSSTTLSHRPFLESTLRSPPLFRPRRLHAPPRHPKQPSSSDPSTLLPPQFSSEKPSATTTRLNQRCMQTIGVLWLHHLHS